MDNMGNMTVGIDDELERDERRPKEETADNVIKLRKPYTVWAVDGTEYRLKLTSSAITQLEKKFGKSLMSAVLDEGIPPVSVVITLLQAAMQKFNHGIKSYTVEDLFDKYIDAGGTQITLLSDVVYPLMGDAGFFTDGMMESLTREISKVDSSL